MAKLVLLSMMVAMLSFSGGEEHKKHKQVIVKGDEGLVIKVEAESDGEMETRKLVIDDEEILLDDMEVGETRTFYTDEGKEIIATRNEEGMTLNIDGKVMELMHFDGELDFDIDEEMEALHEIHVMGDDTVITTEIDGLDEDIQKKIRVALSKAGAGKAIFIGEDGEHVNIGDDHNLVWVGENGDVTIKKHGDKKKVVIIKEHEDDKEEDQ